MSKVECRTYPCSILGQRVELDLSRFCIGITFLMLDKG